MLAAGDDAAEPAPAASAAVGCRRSTTPAAPSPNSAAETNISTLGSFDPQAERAQIDGEEEHVAARRGLREAGGARQPGDAAAATEAEDRQPLDVGAERHAVRSAARRGSAPRAR